MFCKKCGKELKGEVGSCGICGNKTLSLNDVKSEAKDASQFGLKCGNCGFIGEGKKNRSFVVQLFIWLLFPFMPIITILYYVFTNKYICPKCSSNFLGKKNKHNIYVTKKSNIAFIVLIVFMIIATIGLLSTLAVVSLNNARLKARDARRVSDVMQIQTAVEMYYTDNSVYPKTITIGEPIYSGGVTFMGEVPKNPLPNEEGCDDDFEYEYSSESDGSYYYIFYCLGNDTSRAKKGLNLATPKGLSVGIK